MAPSVNITQEKIIKQYRPAYEFGTGQAFRRGSFIYSSFFARFFAFSNARV